MYVAKASQISVVIPVYNSEKYLSECVESVLAQDYPDLEIILVDDGSTDGSVEICDRLEAENPAVVRTCHIKNAGPGNARNVGARLASGQYIQFVDSDDVVSPVFLSTMMQTLVKTGADMVRYPRTFPLSDCPAFSNTKSSKDLPSVSIYSPLMAVEKILYQRWDCGPVLSIQEKNLVIDHPFSDSTIGEDLLQGLQMIGDCDSIALIDDSALYAYRKVEGSLLHSAASNEKADSALRTSRELHRFIVMRFPSLKNAACSRCFSLLRSVFAQADYCLIPGSKDLFDELKKYRRSVLSDPHARKREKLSSFIACFGRTAFWLYCYLCRQIGLMR